MNYCHEKNQLVMKVKDLLETQVKAGKLRAETAEVLGRKFAEYINDSTALLDQILNALPENVDKVGIEKEFLKRLKETYKALEETARNADSLPVEDALRVVANAIGKATLPLDKVNSKVWKDNSPGLFVYTGTKKMKKKGLEVGVIYGINFGKLPDGVNIIGTWVGLDLFDKRCYMAVSSLFEAGNEIMSATQIYKAMGNPGRPSTEDLRKINVSLTKMGMARVVVDNEKAARVMKGYAHFKFDGPLLSFNRVSLIVNGGIAESAIKLLDEPPLMAFAKRRKQMTTVSIKILETPLRKTDANLTLEDYLLERVGRMKKPGGERRIKFATVFEECDVKTLKQKSRTLEKIRRLLEYWKECGWIQNFTEDAEGVTVQP